MQNLNNIKNSSKHAYINNMADKADEYGMDVDELIVDYLDVFLMEENVELTSEEKATLIEELFQIYLGNVA